MVTDCWIIAIIDRVDRVLYALAEHGLIDHVTTLWVV